jgi:hypothetical protein
MLNELGALLKYEFRFYFRFLPPLYLLMVIVALIVRFQGNFTGIDEMENGNQVPFFILSFIWTVMLIAMIVITIVHIVQRFINNFMKDQGSIMFTLPVTIWTLLASKIIAAFCMVLVSTVTVYISMFIFTKGMRDLMSIIMTDMTNFPVPSVGEIVIIVCVVSAMISQEICRIYLAITVSYLLPRFRFVAGCGIYLALSHFLEQSVSRFAGKNINVALETYSRSAFRLGLNNDIYLSLIPFGVAALAFTALYFWATGFILQRTFNLE